MDPDFDITLNSDEESSSDLAKGHFLDSLGLGERSLLGGLAGTRSESFEEDGVILSSMPDELGFPTPGVAPDRGVATYAKMKTPDRDEVSAISLPVEEDPRPEPQEPSNVAPEVENAPVRDLDDSLHLQCPECRGSLVLKRRHLGIEGACVWCHTPIVAAESARDGQVRIFPILGHLAAAQVAGEVEPAGDASAPVADETAHPVVTSDQPPASLEPVSITPPIEEESPSDFPEVPVSFSGLGDLTGSASNEEIPAAFAGFGFSMPPASVDAAAPEIAPAVDTGTTAPDLDSLYETGGFLANQEAPPLAVGFGETLATPAVEEPIPGFGAFLQAPQGNPNSAPSPGIAPIETAPIETAPIETAPIEIERNPASGFLTPTPWGPPAPVSGPSAVVNATSATNNLLSKDEAPSELPAGFASGFGSPAPVEPTPPSWEAAFGDGKELASEPAPVAATGAPNGFGEGFLNADFASAAPSTLFGTATDQAPSTNTGLLMQPSVAVKVQEESKALEDSRTFAPPFHAFSTGSSADAEPGIAKNLFGDPSPSSSLWGNEGPSDEAPTLLAPLNEPSGDPDAAPLFETDKAEVSNPFADKTPLPSPAPFPHTDFPGAVPDEEPRDPATPAKAAAPAGPPALPTSEMTATTAPAVVPQVTSQPLGNKPKPKVRKGFIVLMVVIVGFASGAALASFILPVEEYVSAARAFMESKFGARVEIPQMHAMPEGLAMPTAPADPAQAQP